MRTNNMKKKSIFSKILFLFFSSIIITLTLLSAVYAYECNELNAELQNDCEYLQTTNPSLIANLVYTQTSNPDHEFINNYNSEIIVEEAPNNTPTQSNDVIKNAWTKILTIQPSVLYNNKLFVSNNSELRTEYDYDVVVPPTYYNNNKQDGATCKIIYSLQSRVVSITNKADDEQVSTSKFSTININEDSELSTAVDITATIKNKKYEWDKYCRRRVDGHCVSWGYKCEYDKTTYNHYNLLVEDEISVSLYNAPQPSTFSFIANRSNTLKGELNKTLLTNTKIIFSNNQFYQEQDLTYTAIFINEPYSFLQLTANFNPTTKSQNVINTNEEFLVNNPKNCVITTSSFFSFSSRSCQYAISQENLQPFVIDNTGWNGWNLLIKIIMFILANLLIFRLVKTYWGKILVPITMFFILFIFLTPSVSAVTNTTTLNATNTTTTCGLSNLASCIPEKMFDFSLNMINSPLQPILNWVKNLLSNPVSIDAFFNVWAIIIYCLSIFYTFLLIYSGIQFMISGHNVLKREMAKEWLKNTIIMIVMVQASFFIYELIIHLGSVLTTTILTWIDPSFFLLTANNLLNVALEFLLTFTYAITLLFTLLLLGIRYLIVAFGVILFPIGIFCYFIPPLRSYGKLIMNILAMNIFVTFITSVIILGCSMLVTIPAFQNIEILVMICCFSIVNILFFILTKHAIKKSAVGDGAEKMAQAAKYIAMMV
jgi:hypothetical protein